MSPPGDLLRHGAELRHHEAGEAGDAELQALEVGDRLDLLAEPAAHLGARVAARQAVHVVLGVELVQQVVAAALIQPGVHLARVEPEGERRADGEGRVLAEIVIRTGMGHLDGGIADRVRDLRAARRSRRLRSTGSGICRRWPRSRIWRRSRPLRRSCRGISGSRTAGATAGRAKTARWPGRRRRLPRRPRRHSEGIDDVS